MYITYNITSYGKNSSRLVNIRFTNIPSQRMSLLTEELMCIYLEVESILKSERAISLCLETD